MKKSTCANQERLLQLSIYIVAVISENIDTCSLAVCGEGTMALANIDMMEYIGIGVVNIGSYNVIISIYWKFKFCTVICCLLGWYLINVKIKTNGLNKHNACVGDIDHLCVFPYHFID